VAVNVMVRSVHAPYVHDFAGFNRPWARLAGYVEDLRVHEVALGGGYLAVGRTPGGPRRQNPSDAQTVGGSP